MKIIITESQYRLIAENEEKTLDDKIKDYITELYNGNREDIVYNYPIARPKIHFRPPNYKSHFEIRAHAKYPITRNKLGLPSNMSGMPYIQVDIFNWKKPITSKSMETLIIIFTKEALKPIMDKFNLDNSYVEKLKQIYIDTLSNFGFNMFGGSIIWMDKTSTLIKGLKSYKNKFDFWLRIARENGLMDGYMEELKNTGENSEETLTESQYKLISEREDNKYMKELNAVYRLFVDKFNKRDFTQRQLITQKGFILTLSMTLNTDFGDLIVQLTEERWTGYGQYHHDDSGVTVPKIIIYNCKFALGDENYVNHRGSQTQMKKIIGISGFNKQAFKHEIIHFIDDKKNRKLSGKPDMSQKDWHNDSFEINAEFLSIMNEIRFQKDYVLPKTFEDFLNSYKRFNVVTISQWENLTDKKKKSLVGRLYQYYTFLKDVFKKKKEKEANNI